jgi:hypothetical protein
VELVYYNHKFDPKYFNNLIVKAKKDLERINADQWLNNIRGYYEAYHNPQ